MRSTGVILCAVPAHCWTPDASKTLTQEEEYLQRFLPELSYIERRLGKGLAEEEESLRFSRLCTQIELCALKRAKFADNRLAFHTILRRGHFPALRVDSAYLDLIRLVLQHAPQQGDLAGARIGHSVLAPGQVPRHVSLFESMAKSLGYLGTFAIHERLIFLKRWAMPKGLGIIEIADPLSLSKMEELREDFVQEEPKTWWQRWLRSADRPPELRQHPEKRSIAPPRTVFNTQDALDWQYYGLENRGNFMEERLRGQIRDALHRGAPIRLNNQRHNMTTKILHEFLHRDPANPPGEAPLTYDEATTPAPFPLRCLDRLPANWQPTAQLHAGLISMRHLEIDQYVDINWYRNVEIPSRKGLAHADQFCFEYSLKHLEELLEIYRGAQLELSVYHAGFLPGVVGFYRALVLTLRGGRYPKGCIQVIPKIQPDKTGGFLEGRRWPERER